MTQASLVASAWQGFKISWWNVPDNRAVVPPSLSSAHNPCPDYTVNLLNRLPVLALFQSRLRAMPTVPLRNADPAITCHWAPPVHLKLLGFRI